MAIAYIVFASLAVLSKVSKRVILMSLNMLDAVYKWLYAVRIFMYMTYWSLFAPRTRILSAQGFMRSAEETPRDISTQSRDITREVICFYRYSRIISCASLQRWLRTQTRLNYDAVQIIYMCEKKIISRTYNLNDDLGNRAEIAWNEPEQIVDDISLD